ESVEKRLDRPLAHRLVALELVRARSERHDRREEAGRRPRVADEHGGARNGQLSPASLDDEAFSGLAGVDGDAERAEAPRHVKRVVAEERTLDGRSATGQDR